MGEEISGISVHFTPLAQTLLPEVVIGITKNDSIGTAVECTNRNEVFE